MKKRGTVSGAVCALVVLSLVAACSNALPRDTAEQGGQTPDPASTATQSDVLASSLSRLGPELLLQLRAQGADGDLVVSPYSVYSALAMTKEGAQGDTLAEMNALLHVEDADPIAARQAYADFGRWMTESTGALPVGQSGTPLQIHSANALWVGQGLQLKAPFADTARTWYAARAESVDFGSAGTVDTINGWVSEQTKGKITDLLDSLDPATRLVLTNALYLKGSWTEPFNKDLTADAPFTLADGTKVQLPTMQGAFTQYAETDAYQAGVVPMLGGDMLLYLPKTGSSVDDVLEALATEGASERAWEEVAGTLYLPRFKAGWKNSIASPLQQLGMKAAFDGADFSGISDEPLFVSDVVHAATTEVDETGIEASAATAVVMLRGAPGAPPKTVELRIDRSFVYVVRAGGVPLFYGVVADPR